VQKPTNGVPQLIVSVDVMIAACSQVGRGVGFAQKPTENYFATNDINVLDLPEIEA
jgi:hypothetical protein